MNFNGVEFECPHNELEGSALNSCGSIQVYPIQII